MAADYDWLLFDADGTLFDYDAAERSALALACQNAGLHLTAGLLAAYRAINQDLWQALERGQISPSTLKIERFERLLAHCDKRGCPREFSDFYLARLGERADLMPGAESVVKTLSHEYPIAILTNGLTVVQRGRLGRAPIAPWVRALVISEEVGAAKPAPGYFAAALAAIGNPRPRRCLMIGDNWVSDIQGAAGFGLDTCWFNPRSLPRPAGLPPTHEIGKLCELPGLLASGPGDLKS